MWFAGNCSVLEYLEEWRQLSCSRAENSAAGLGTQAAGSAGRMAKFFPSFICVTIHWALQAPVGSGSPPEMITAAVELKD